MVDSGLLDEVVDIYKPDADYTKGIRQAIGVREFADFLRCFSCEPQNSSSSSCSLFSADKTLKELHRILGFSDANKQKLLLTEAIEEVKLNTRRLVRRQVSLQSSISVPR